MKTLAIDIETYSSTDLKSSGVYKYVEAPDFAILLIAYSVNGGPVNIIDLASGDTIPDEFLSDLDNMFVLKTAWNANFEMTCLRKQLGLPMRNWECSMAKASMLGLPLSLDACAKVLKIGEEKSSTGKALIKYFSVPCKATKVNGGRLRNLPEHAPDKWKDFKDYNIQDVVVEQAIRNKIEWFSINENEKKLWKLDQRINNNGILIHSRFVRNAIDLDLKYKEQLTKEAVELTGLNNPNSASQLKEWLQNEMPFETVDTLRKDDIPKYLESTDSAIVSRVLQLRQEMSKTSVKKYITMAKAECENHRICGLFQYYGANRTGRWAGRLVQVQNLPQNHIKDLDLARELVLSKDLELLIMCFGNVPDILSQLIRTAFIAKKDHRFIVADFSAIEARVIAWLAGERWRLDVFNSHGKIYEASASQMFRIPIDEITKPLRQKGKIAELALGYQGGPNALITMGALKMGLVEEELPKLVSMWRNSNKKIVEYWQLVGDAAMQTVNSGQTTTITHGISFMMQKGILFIQLPGGRKLAYYKPTIGVNRFGNMSLMYEGMDQTSKKWGQQETYGGKLVENIVQAIARDILADAMLRMDEKGYELVMHVHDELVSEMPEGKGSVEEVNEILSTPISWARGLPLSAESYETKYYKKD